MPLNFFFKFTDAVTKAGKTGLVVTANINSISKANQSVSNLTSSAACTEVGGGIYVCGLEGADLTGSDYVATATPSDASGLTSADADSLQSDFSSNSIKPGGLGDELNTALEGRFPANFAALAIQDTTGAIVRVLSNDDMRGTNNAALASDLAVLSESIISFGGTMDNMPANVWGYTVRGLTERVGFSLANDGISAAALSTAAVAKIQNGLFLAASFVAPATPANLTTAKNEIIAALPTGGGGGGTGLSTEQDANLTAVLDRLTAIPGDGPVIIIPEADDDPTKGVVFGYFQTPGIEFYFTPVSRMKTSAGRLINETITAKTDEEGVLNVSLYRSDSVTPSGTKWRVVCHTLQVNKDFKLLTETFNIGTLI